MLGLNRAVLPFVLRQLVQLSLPPLLVYLFFDIVFSHFAVSIPSWIVVLATALSNPLAFWLRGFWFSLRDRRAAGAMGATLPPTLVGKRIGNYDLFQQMLDERRAGYPGECEVEFSKKVGHTFNLSLLWQNRIFTSEPDYIRTMLSSDFKNYEKGPELFQSFASVLGVGIFNSDGDMWKFHRAMGRPFFSRDRISDLDILDRHSETAITKLKSRMAQGYAVDFQDLVSRLTLDSTTDFLFGHCVHSLLSDMPYPKGVISQNEKRWDGSDVAEGFSRAFAGALHVISERFRVGWAWRFFEIFGDKSKDPMGVIRPYLDPIIAEAVRKSKGLSSSEKAIKEDETFLDHLVKTTNDPTVLFDEVLNILMAGRDTTAATLTFAIYGLAMHPQILTRLREEILSIVGPSRRPTADDIKAMKFLKAVVNETLRLFPPIPWNTRTVINNTTWHSMTPDGKPLYIPAGTEVLYSTLSMHRRKDLWGPDADEFDPDRFLDDRAKTYLQPNPHIFQPFGIGPRICIGQQFAYTEVSFFLIRLLQTFDSVTLGSEMFSPDLRVPESWKHREGRQGMEKFRPKYHLSMYSDSGMWVNMTEAPTANI